MVLGWHLYHRWYFFIFFILSGGALDGFCSVYHNWYFFLFYCFLDLYHKWYFFLFYCFLDLTERPTACKPEVCLCLQTFGLYTINDIFFYFFSWVVCAGCSNNTPTLVILFLNQECIETEVSHPSWWYYATCLHQHAPYKHEFWDYCIVFNLLVHITNYFIFFFYVKIFPLTFCWKHYYVEL